MTNVHWSVKYARKLILYGFSMWDGFFSPTVLRIPPESLVSYVPRPKIQRYLMLCVTLTGIGKEVMVKIKGILYICIDHATDWHQVHVCWQRWSGWFGHKWELKYYSSYKRHAENYVFCYLIAWIWNDDRCFVQLNGTKYVQICESVWDELSTQNTTRFRDGRTHGRTDARTQRTGGGGGAINGRNIGIICVNLAHHSVFMSCHFLIIVYLSENITHIFKLSSISSYLSEVNKCLFWEHVLCFIPILTCSFWVLPHRYLTGLQASLHQWLWDAVHDEGQGHGLGSYVPKNPLVVQNQVLNI